MRPCPATLQLGGKARVRCWPWLSDRPLDEDEGACGDVLMRVMLRTEISRYDWVEEGKPYREWLVPADLLNALAKIELIE